MAGSAKVLILFSTAAGLFVQAWLGSRQWPPLLVLTIGSFVTGFALVRWMPRSGWAPFLIAAYVYPVIFLAWINFFTFSYYSIWLSALLGAVLASASPIAWHLPAAWRLPLVFWAVAVALSWPVVAFREMNFMWSALGEHGSANSGLGGPPPVVIVGMLVSVLPQMLGIVWFDAMFARFSGRLADFRRAIVVPLAIGLTAGSALAIYQRAADISFLSAHQWPYYGRAAGGLLDGNAFGAIAGLWSGAMLSLALVSGLAYAAFGFVVSLLAWLGLWATGSRMAVLAGLIGLAAVVAAGLRSLRDFRSFARVALIIIAAAAIGTTLASRARWKMDPISRTLKSLPKPSYDAASRFVEFQFWNRFGPFGTASVRMLRDSPGVGVGTGAFEPLYPDYAYVVTNGKTRSHFDNAQSWYRHRLAELGVLGSLGWIAWLGLFGVFVLRTPAVRDGITEATGVKAALASLAVISIVSMPARNPFVSLSFWVFAFWLTLLASREPGPRWLAAIAARRAAWAAVWALAIGFVVMTAWTGYTRFRPPHRAMMANWDYLNGISRPVKTDEGIVRYTQEHGVAVFYAIPGAYLRLQFQLAHVNAGSSRVHVKIFQGDAQVGHFVISDRNWHELYIKVPEGKRDRMMLQATVDRPAMNASVPARGLILKDWEFVSVPPPDAMIAQHPEPR